MSNVIPPLVSSSPPPVLPDDDEDEFGDFTTNNDYSYDDGLSLPTTPQKLEIDPVLDAYQPTIELSIDSEDQKINFPTETDNTSQDSVLSIVTSDSSEILSSFSDDHNKNQQQNTILNTLNKDFLDVRNETTNNGNTDLCVQNKTEFLNISSGRDSNDKLKVDNIEIEVSSTSNRLDNIVPFGSNCDDLKLTEQDAKTPTNNCLNEHRKSTEDVSTNNLSRGLEDVSSEKIRDSESNSNNVDLYFENSADITSEKQITESNFDGEDNFTNQDSEVSEICSQFDCPIKAKIIEESEIEDYSSEQSFKNNLIVEKDSVSTNTFTEIDSSKSSLQNFNEFENSNDFDDFADFRTALEIVQNEEVTQNNEQFVESKKILSDKHVCSDDEFDDFVEFSIPPSNDNKTNETCQQGSCNEWEIIQLFSKKRNTDSDKEKLVKMIHDIFVDAFPPTELDDKFTAADNENRFPELLHNNELWNRLEDVENLKPLLYRWEKSMIYQKYLKIINIDTRNILYGTNVNVPRFAANLSTPLEPLKPVPVSLPSVTNNTSQETTLKTDENLSTSTTQFDWNDSGLVNPLEYSQNSDILLDLEELLSTLNNITDANIIEQDHCEVSLEADIVNIDAWEYWTKYSTTNKEDKIEESTSPEVIHESVNEESLNKETESVKSLKFSDFGTLNNIEETVIINNNTNKAENNNNEIIDDDDAEFTDFHSSVQPRSMVCPMNLRETHISTTPTDYGTDFKPAWFKPTVLTPELPRKLIEPSQKTEETQSTSELSQPCEEIPVVVQTEENKDKLVDNDDFADFQFATNTTAIESQIKPPTNTIPLNVLPISASPLKPIKLENNFKSVEINWPDPGISDDQLERLNNLQIESITNLSKTDCKFNSEFGLETNLENLEPQIESKTQLSTSEDEWSDFVSVSKAPQLTTQSQMITQDSTKLASKNSLELFPKCVNYPLINSSVQNFTNSFSNHMFDVPNKQSLENSINLMKPNPVLFSNQPNSEIKGATQLDLKTSNTHLAQINPYLNQNNFELKCSNSIFSKSEVNNSNDDDWSDFVSSRDSVSQQANNCSLKSINTKSNWIDSPNFTNWNAPTTTFTPNIIMNPAHFDTLNGEIKRLATSRHQTHTLQTTMSHNQGKHSISTISNLPDLEFLTPKSILRTKSTKK